MRLVRAGAFGARGISWCSSWSLVAVAGLKLRVNVSSGRRRMLATVAAMELERRRRQQ